MDAKLSWDEAKRQINLRKHGLDFALAGAVLDSRYRLDIPVVRGAEPAVKKERLTLSGSKTKAMRLKDVITALKAKEREAPYVWDGQDEDERPGTSEELAHGVDLARKRGRPAGSGVKEQVAIRLDKDILEAFRAQGQGWQTRINQALRCYLAEHPAQS